MAAGCHGDPEGRSGASCLRAPTNRGRCCASRSRRLVGAHVLSASPRYSTAGVPAKPASRGGCSIQQAVLQVLQAVWDPTFSEASYGFRPRRSAHQAVARAQEHIADGHGWVVDLDLEKFFDRMNHDILMGLPPGPAGPVPFRGRIEGLLAFDGQAGCRPAHPKAHPRVSCRRCDGGWVGRADGRGDPARRPTFALAVEPDAGCAGQGADPTWSLLRSLCRRLQHLRAQPPGGRAGHDERHQLRHQAPPASGEHSQERSHPMAACCHGDPGVLRELHQWLRRRLRAFAWKQWRNGWNRFRQMARRGVPRRLAAQTAGSVHGPWRIAASPALNIALSNADLAALGLPVMTPRAA